MTARGGACFGCVAPARFPMIQEMVLYPHDYGPYYETLANSFWTGSLGFCGKNESVRANLSVSVLCAALQAVYLKTHHNGLDK